MLESHIVKQMNEDELRNYVFSLQEMLSLTAHRASVRGEINDLFRGLLAAKEEELCLAMDIRQVSKKHEDYMDLLREKYGLRPVCDMPEREVSDGK